MTMDAYKDSAPRRFAKGAVLALGFGTIWAAVSLWLGTTILNSGIGEEVPRSEMIRVSADGAPRIDSYPVDDYSRKTSRDLDGRELPETSTGGDIQQLFLTGEPRAWPAAAAGLPWTSRIRIFLNERDPTAVWYFIQDAEPQGTGAFVGYERVSNRVVGHIGLAGFREGPIPDDERIPASFEAAVNMQHWSSLPISVYSSAYGWSTQTVPGDVPPRLAHIPSGNILRVVDLDDGAVRTAFEAPEPIVSAAVPYLFSYMNRGGPNERDVQRAILVRTPGKVFRLDHAYKVIGTFVIPPEVPPGVALSWYEAGDGSAVVTSEPPMRDVAAHDNRKRDVMVYRVAADGAIREATKVELANGSALASGRAMLGLAAAVIPAPAPLLATEAAMASNDPNRGYPAALAAMLAASLPGLAAAAALATALAAAAWRRARAFGLPPRERAAWAAFVGLFGLPGWVGFRLHRAWPARAACPRCGARAPRDRPDCIACGEPFPAPAATGTEIFA